MKDETTPVITGLKSVGKIHSASTEYLIVLSICTVYRAHGTVGQYLFTRARRPVERHCHFFVPMIAPNALDLESEDQQGP